MFQSDQYLSKENIYLWCEAVGINIRKQTVAKNEVFLRHKQRCHYFFFIAKGFIRLYYLDIEGNEITHWFSAENMMITSPFSFYRGETNILNFEALEETELFLLTKDQIDQMREHNKQANDAFHNLVVDFAMRFSRRVMSIHTESAEYRYLRLLKEYPLIFQKAKLAHIASFLGITQQSLSRIRKNLVY